MVDSASTDELIDLQQRVSFQEDTLQKLNCVVSKQDVDIRNLQAQVQILTDKLGNMIDAFEQVEIISSNEKPPHY